ncbi:MAG: type II toxin-antitoxin system HicB family antitoxin [Nitrospirota bacterium]
MKSSGEKKTKRKVSKEAVRRVHGMLKSGASATKALIAERATDKERENCAGERMLVTVKRKVYDVILHPDAEDGGYWVECPVLPGCDSQGDTVEEALEMIKDAIKGHLEVTVEKKKKRATPAA